MSHAKETVVLEQLVVSHFQVGFRLFNMQRYIHDLTIFVLFAQEDSMAMRGALWVPFGVTS